MDFESIRVGDEIGVRATVGRAPPSGPQPGVKTLRADCGGVSLSLSAADIVWHRPMFVPGDRVRHRNLIEPDGVGTVVAVDRGLAWVRFPWLEEPTTLSTSALKIAD